MTFTAPGDFVTTWDYTVGDAAEFIDFSAFTCGPSCGTISYSAYLDGEPDFGELEGLLSFDEANLRLDLLLVDSNLKAGVYTIVVELEEDLYDSVDVTN